MSNERNEETAQPPCSICGAPLDIKRTPAGEVYWRGGNNAAPINNGRCCDECNDNHVVPVRIRQALNRHNA